jgi:hypothetical protein
MTKLDTHHDHFKGTEQTALAALAGLYARCLCSLSFLLPYVYPFGMSHTPPLASERSRSFSKGRIACASMPIENRVFSLFGEEGVAREG